MQVFYFQMKTRWTWRKRKFNIFFTIEHCFQNNLPVFWFSMPMMNCAQLWTVQKILTMTVNLSSDRKISDLTQFICLSDDSWWGVLEWVQEMLMCSISGEVDTTACRYFEKYSFRCNGWKKYLGVLVLKSAWQKWHTKRDDTKISLPICLDAILPAKCRLMFLWLVFGIRKATQ